MSGLKLVCFGIFVSSMGWYCEVPVKDCHILVILLREEFSKALSYFLTCVAWWEWIVGVTSCEVVHSPEKLLGVLAVVHNLLCYYLSFVELQ